MLLREFLQLTKGVSQDVELLCCGGKIKLIIEDGKNLSIDNDGDFELGDKANVLHGRNNQHPESKTN